MNNYLLQEESHGCSIPNTPLAKAFLRCASIYEKIVLPDSTHNIRTTVYGEECNPYRLRVQESFSFLFCIRYLYPA